MEYKEIFNFLKEKISEETDYSLSEIDEKLESGEWSDILTDNIPNENNSNSRAGGISYKSIQASICDLPNGIIYTYVWDNLYNTGIYNDYLGMVLVGNNENDSHFYVDSILTANCQNPELPPTEPTAA